LEQGSFRRTTIFVVRWNQQNAGASDFSRVRSTLQLGMKFWTRQLRRSPANTTTISNINGEKYVRQKKLYEVCSMCCGRTSSQNYAVGLPDCVE
jgi:hypothetical protein